MSGRDSDRKGAVPGVVYVEGKLVDSEISTGYRGAVRKPGTIYQTGFESHGSKMDLFKHVNPVGENYWNQSGYVSTSASRDVAVGFPKGARGTSYVYKIQLPPNAVNVGARLPGIVPDTFNAEDLAIFLEEREMAIPRKIKPSDIEGAWKVKITSEHTYSDPDWDDASCTRTLSEKFIPNPGFNRRLTMSNVLSSGWYQGLRTTARGATALGLGVDVVSFYRSVVGSRATGNYDYVVNETARVVGGWSGAAAFGAAGAEGGVIACGLGGPLGWAGCGFVGGLAGAIVGYKAGSSALPALVYNVRSSRGSVPTLTPAQADVFQGSVWNDISLAVGRAIDSVANTGRNLLENLVRIQRPTEDGFMPMVPVDAAPLFQRRPVDHNPTPTPPVPPAPPAPPSITPQVRNSLFHNNAMESHIARQMGAQPSPFSMSFNFLHQHHASPISLFDRPSGIQALSFDRGYNIGADHLTGVSALLGFNTRPSDPIACFTERMFGAQTTTDLWGNTIDSFGNRTDRYGHRLDIAGNAYDQGGTKVDYLGRPNYSSSEITQALKMALSAEAGNMFWTVASVISKVNAFLGASGAYSTSDFASLLQSTGLVGSYNAYNSRELRVLSKLCNDIGGVATSVGLLKGLRNSVEDVMCERTAIAMKLKYGRVPFESAQLRQLIRELTQAIFIHETFPFFSLHFNDEGELYPVLHPAYQNTLVGEVIGYLDYFLKSFLNGGTYDIAFLRDWHKTRNHDLEYLRQHVMDIKAIAKAHGIKYVSSRELLQREKLDHLAEGEDASKYGMKFMTSFRIISERGEVQKSGDTFMVDPDFRVEHSVDLRPDYAELLRRETELNGTPPEEFEKLQSVYKQMAKSVHDVMPKLPFCRDYFQMLGVINFLCYLINTYKSMGRQLDLESIPSPEQAEFPPVLPPIPVRYSKYFPVQLTLADLLKTLGDAASPGRAEFDRVIREALDHDKLEYDDFALLRPAVIALVSPQLPPDIAMDEEAQIETFNKVAKILVRQLQIEAQTVSPIVGKICFFEVIFGEAGSARIQSGIDLDSMTENLAFQSIVSSKSLSRTLALVRETLAQKRVMVSEKINAHYDQLLVQKLQKDIDAFVAQVNQQCEEVIPMQEEMIRKGGAEALESAKREHGSRLDVDRTKAAIDAQVEADIVEMKTGVMAQREALLTETKAQIEGEIRSKVTEIKAGLLEKVSEILDELEGELTTFERTISHMSSHWLSSEEEASLDLMTQYEHSVLEIGNRDLYQKMGMSQKIVGGCGVNIENYTPLKLAQSVRSRVESQLEGVPAETFISFEDKGEAYAAMQVPVKFSPIIGQEDLRPIAQLFEASGDESLKIGEAEEKAFGALVLLEYTADTTEWAVPEFNISARDEAGQTMAHRVAEAGLVKAIRVLNERDPAWMSHADHRGRLPIHIAAASNQVNFIEALLRLEPGLLEVPMHNHMTPLFCAVEEGRLEAVRALIMAGANPNHTLPNGLTPLFIATQKGYQAVALALLESGLMNVNTMNDNHVTPLHMALELGLEELAHALIIRGANVNHPTRKTGRTPILVASLEGLTESLSVMVSQGAVLTSRLESLDTAAHLAIQGGHLETLIFLVNNLPVLAHQANRDGQTPLMLAIQCGKIDCALYLASQYVGADAPKINDQNNLGKTALMLAAEFGPFSVIELILRTPDLDVLIKDRIKDETEDTAEAKDKSARDAAYYLLRHGRYYHFTQLHQAGKVDVFASYGEESTLAIATYSGNTMLMDYLEEQGVKFTSAIKPGWESIQYAIARDDLNTLKKWVAEDEKPRGLFTSQLAASISSLFAARSGFELPPVGSTHLQLAAQCGALECFKYLIRRASKESIDREFNIGLLEIVADQDSPEILNLVMQKIESVNAPSAGTGNTIAHWVVENGRMNLVKELSQYGVNWLQKNSAGLSPFHLCVLHDDKEMLEAMLSQIKESDIPKDLLSFASLKAKKSCREFLSKKYPAHFEAVDNHRALLEASLGNYRLCHQLMTEGVSPTMDALKIAMMGGHYSIAILLIEHGAPIGNGEKLYQYAVKHESIEVLEYLFGHGLLDLPAGTIKQAAARAATPMLSAAFSGNFEPYNLLKAEMLEAIEASDISTVTRCLHRFPIKQALFDYQGVRRPLLHIALMQNYEALVSELRRAGVNPLLRDLEGHAVMCQFLTPASKLRWIKKYFPSQDRAIFTQTLGHLSDNTVMDELSALGQNLLITQLQQAGFPKDYVSHNHRTLCHRAAIEGSQSLIQMALELFGQNIDAKEVDGHTALMLAASKGHLSLVKWMIKQGVNPNLVNRYGETAFILACKMDKTDVAEYLLGVTQDIDHADRHGYSAFLYAAQKGLLSVVTRLLAQPLVKTDRQTIYKNSALALASLAKDLSIFKQLLSDERFNDPVIRLEAARFAAQYGKIEALKLLVHAGVDLCDETNGTAPIALAIAFGNDDVVRALREYPEFYEPKVQQQLLSFAAERNRLFAVRELLLNQADINAVDPKSGATALVHAAVGDAVQAAELLCRSGADLTIASVDGMTPLHHAASVGSVGVMRVLLAHGANPHTETTAGKTVMAMAREKNHEAAVQLLLRTPDHAEYAKPKSVSSPRLIALKDMLPIFNQVLESAAQNHQLSSLFSQLSLRSIQMALIGFLKTPEPERKVLLLAWMSLLEEYKTDLAELDKKSIFSQYSWDVCMTGGLFMNWSRLDTAGLKQVFFNYMAPKILSSISPETFAYRMEDFDLFLGLYLKYPSEAIVEKVELIKPDIAFQCDDGKALRLINSQLEKQILEGAELHTLFVEEVKKPPETATDMLVYSEIFNPDEHHALSVIARHFRQGKYSLSAEEFDHVIRAMSPFLLKPYSVREGHEDGFIFYASFLKEELGTRIFRKFFEISWDESLAYSISLELFSSVVRLMVSLEGEVDLCALIEAHMPRLSEMKAALEAESQRMLERKFPEKSLEDVVAAFSTQTDFTSELLPVDEIAQIEKVMPVVEAVFQELQSISEESLKERIKDFGNLVKDHPDNDAYRAQLLGALSVAMKRTHNKKPYRTQLFALMALTNPKEGFKGRMAQILTGEGKSLDLAMLNGFYAVQGEFVDVITSSENLAERDQQEYKDFYESVGVTSSYLPDGNQTRENFKGQIVYATNVAFEFAQLREMIYGHDIRYTEINGEWVKRPFDRVIVDEVDNLFLDTALNAARIAVSARHDISWLYRPLLEYYQTHEGFGVFDMQLDIGEMFKDDPEKHAILSKISVEQFERWCDAIDGGLKRERGKDYVIKEGKVVIIDCENTGREQPRMRWTGGEHEFVEVLNGIEAKTETKTSGSLSHPAFFREYAKISGVTGTMGEQVERNEVRRIYGVDTFDVPPHKPLKRIQKTSRYILDKENYFKTLYQESYKATQRGQPCLILLRSIKDTEEFSEYLKKNHLPHNVLNTQQQEGENHLIDIAGQAGRLTIATNTAGRGVDIRLTKDALEAGGMHVIFGYPPVNKRVLKQGIGRGARRGEPGSWQEIIWRDDLALKNLISKESYRHNIPERQMPQLLDAIRRKQTEKASAHRVYESSNLILQYDLLKRFSVPYRKLAKDLESLSQDAFLRELARTRITEKPDLAFAKNKMSKGQLCFVRRGLSAHATSADKTLMFETLKELYIRYVGQLWAEHFTEMDRDRDRPQDFESLKALRNQQFEEFMAGDIAKYFGEGYGGFYYFCHQVVSEIRAERGIASANALSFALQAGSHARVVTNGGVYEPS